MSDSTMVNFAVPPMEKIRIGFVHTFPACVIHRPEQIALRQQIVQQLHQLGGIAARVVAHIEQDAGGTLRQKGLNGMDGFFRAALVDPGGSIPGGFFGAGAGTGERCHAGQGVARHAAEHYGMCLMKRRMHMWYTG